MSGCSGGATGPGLPPAVAVDLAATRCPEPSSRDKAEAQRVTPAPDGDLKREHVDALRLSEVKML